MGENGKRITSKLSILGGKPVIKGTRIGVGLILNLVAHGMTTEEILEEYPHLKKSDVFAAIGYAEKVIDKEKIESLNIPR
jgi:uncharacterized protein (DUF433 family)